MILAIFIERKKNDKGRKEKETKEKNSENFKKKIAKKRPHKRHSCNI